MNSGRAIEALPLVRCVRTIELVATNLRTMQVGTPHSRPNSAPKGLRLGYTVWPAHSKAQGNNVTKLVATNLVPADFVSVMLRPVRTHLWRFLRS